MYHLRTNHFPTIGNRLAGATLLGVTLALLVLSFALAFTSPACAKAHRKHGHGHPPRRTTETVYRWSTH